MPCLSGQCRTGTRAEFHSQTGVEAAVTLHKQLKEAGRAVEDIERITIRTHEACIRIIDKQGPLNNPADRDHCIQYMVAVPLIFGNLTAADYEDGVAADPRIDALRGKIVCVEDPQFTKDYHDPDKRSIANALTVQFKDGRTLAGSRRRVPDRPPAPPQGRHPAVGSEVPNQPGAPLPEEAAGRDPRRLARPEKARVAAGERVCRPLRDLNMRTRKTLRKLAAARCGVLVPGAFNALSARVVEDLGFEAIYITGAGVTNMWLGMPDQGFMGLHEIAEHTARIRDAVASPLIVDADTGFGNALNVRHTVRVLERAGADCIQFEDQVAPKRCGHFSGKEVISSEEAVAKIKAAVDARIDPDLLIMARTDACAVLGFDAAVERAGKFSEAGAGILFVEAVQSADEIRRLPQLLNKPQLMNMVIGGKTPIFGTDELGQLGYGIVLYANAALQGAVAGMQKALTVLRDTRRLDEDPAIVAAFQERQRLVGKPAWDVLETSYVG